MSMCHYISHVECNNDKNDDSIRTYSNNLKRSNNNENAAITLYKLIIYIYIYHKYIYIYIDGAGKCLFCILYLRIAPGVPRYPSHIGWLAVETISKKIVNWPSVPSHRVREPPSHG